jgi:GNAT superfamily N-acetyltransferase
MFVSGETRKPCSLAAWRVFATTNGKNPGVPARAGDGEEKMLIRPLEIADEAAWRRLWAGYLAFYKRVLDPEITAATWRRLLDPVGSGMVGRVAVLDGAVVGILHAVIHPNTWSIVPVCYLEDLYVGADVRGRGVGRALIEALAEEGRHAGWLRIYWRTAADNATAQALYDKLARRTAWVTYELDLIAP